MMSDHDLREALAREEEIADGFRYEAQNEVPRSTSTALVYATLAVASELRAARLLNELSLNVSVRS